MKKFIAMILAFGALNACKENEDPRAWVAELAFKKLGAEKAMDSSMLRFEDHAAIKEYFADVAAIAIALKRYPEQREKLVKRAGLGSVESTCRDLLVSREEFERLLSRCQYRDYFVCAEEVRVYKESVQVIAQSLSPDSQASFRSSSSCPQF